MGHVITIVLHDDGTVSGDVDDEIAVWPDCKTQGEATTYDGQARSLLDRALEECLRLDLTAADRRAKRR